MAVVKIFTHYHQRAIIIIAHCLPLTPPFAHNGTKRKVSKKKGKHVRENEPEENKRKEKKNNNGSLLNKRLTHLSFAYKMFRNFYPSFIPMWSLPLLILPFVSYHFCCFALFFTRTKQLNHIIMWILLRQANNNAIHNRWAAGMRKKMYFHSIWDNYTRFRLVHIKRILACN